MEQERIGRLYEKLMKSDYESSYDKQFKEKKLENNQMASTQKTQPAQYFGINILESQKENFSLKPQKCFNSRDMA